MKKKNTRAARLSRHDRREAFLHAAQEIIAKSGIETLTMEGLAAHCDVNKALPYQHFTNRDDLLSQLFDHENKRFDDMLMSHLETLPNAKEKLSALITLWLQSIDDNASTPTLYNARTQNGMLEKKREVRIENSSAFIADLIQEMASVERPKALLIAKVFLFGSQGLAAFHANSGMSKDEIEKTFITLFFSALQTPKSKK